MLLALLGLALPDRPVARVNDYAHVLGGPQRAQLEQQLASYETGTRQVAVAIFPALEDESLEDFTNRLFVKWGLGGKQNDDGVLLTLFVKDRKLCIEVGYGLEDKLTDALSSRIIREIMAPELKKGDYYGALSLGLAEVNHIVNGGQTHLPKRRPSGGSGGLAGLLLFGIVMAILVTWTRRGGGGGFTGGASGWVPRSGWGGGGFSGGGGGFSGGGGGFSGGGGSSGGGGASGSW